MRKQILATGLLLAAFPAPLPAQGLRYQFDFKDTEQAGAEAENVTAEEALQRNRDIYGPPPPRRPCPAQARAEAKPGKEDEQPEIVVCAQEEDQSRHRVQSSAQLDPAGRKATDDGLARAPDVAGEGIFKGKATLGGLCLLGGCPPPPAIIFDISALPEAPEGSDADRIAKGGKPAG